MAANGVESPNPAPSSLPPLVQVPPYSEMILEAINALNNENGSNKKAISDYIKRKYGSNLPSQHTTILTTQLDRMKATGELYFDRNNYFRPADSSAHGGLQPGPDDSVSEAPDGVPALDPMVDADAEVVPAPAPAAAADAGAVSVKRGRGRPPKPKEPLATEPGAASAAVPSVDGYANGVLAPAPDVAGDAGAVPVKRGRGRPPKLKEPVTDELDVPPVPLPVVAEEVPPPVKRGRGRPPKPKELVAGEFDAAPVAVPVVAGDADDVPPPASVVAAEAVVVPVKRGRGRPPKLKEPVAEETDVAPVVIPVVADADADDADINDVDADEVPAPAPADASAVPIKRGRGRPPKAKDPVPEVTVVAPVIDENANAVPVKRGRGRPPKPKDPIAEAVAVATRGMPRARGRPPKKAKVAEEAPIGSPAPATSGSADANAVPVKRGHGHPPKVRP